MAKMDFLKIFLTFFEVILGISATTHWVVTDDGRIQSQLDSVFRLHQPYDLFTFLEQESYMNAISALYRQMVTKKAAIDRQWANLESATDVESRLFSTDPDCLLAKKPLVDIDLYASVVTDGSFRGGVAQKDYLLDGIPTNGKKKVPDCKKTFPLDFSLYTFEHLSAMRNRKNLIQHQEKGLIKYLPPGTDLNMFGHQIAHGLLRNNTSWLHLNLAAIYWRVQGDSYNALECGRRAIVTAPMRYRDIPLLTTGGILHAAKHSGEAAIILHAAIDYAPTQSHQHLALGHVYAVLGDFNRSIACYDNCLRLAPTMDQARQTKHAILCEKKLGNFLSSLYLHLQDLLTDLDSYLSQQEEWLNLERRMVRVQATQSSYVKAQSATFQNDDLSSILANRGQSCMQRGDGDSVLSCDVATGSQILAHNLQMDITVSLRLLKDVESQAQKINEHMIKSKSLHANKQPVRHASAYTLERDPEFLTMFMGPTGRPKYYDHEVSVGTEEYEKENWPEMSDCKQRSLLLSSSKQYVPIYLPPENKGFATQLFVTELIGINSGQEHPLPWYPPNCQTPKSFDRKYIPPALLTASFGNRLADSSLSHILNGLVRDAEIAEIGQRILTATKSKVAAPWVLSMLASLYWRIAGKPRNALDCLQLALDTVPSKFKDVPLVSIASISHKAGLIDEALKIVEEAWNTNSIEPHTNFLIGLLLHLKGNNTGAIYHLKQTLRVDPDWMDGGGLTILRGLACQQKLSNDQPDYDNGDVTLDDDCLLT